MFGNPAEVGFGERLKSETGPRRGMYLAAAQEQALIVTPAVDQDVVFAVAGKKRPIAFDIQMQFHGGRGVGFSLPGRGGSGRIQRFARRCFALQLSLRKGRL